jgi:Na+/melibiose symporter-like transporter
VVIYVAFEHLPESKDPSVEGRIDLAGAVLGATGLAGATWGLIERDARISAVGVALFVAFLVVESRSAHPMLPLSVFRSRQFSAVNAVTLVLYGGLGTALFLTGLVLQEALGYSPLEAGIATLPITAVMLTFSARSGALAQRIGPRIPMTVGPATMACGLALMTRVEPGVTYVGAVLPALVVLSAGLALTVAPLTASALASVDERHAGLASGVNNAVARTGQLLAVSAIPIVAGFTAGSAVGVKTLVDGFHRVSLAAAGLVAVAAVISWAFVRDDVLDVGAAEAGATLAPTPGSVPDDDRDDDAGDGEAGALVAATAGSDDDDPCATRRADCAGRPTYHCGASAPPLAATEPVAR